MLPRLAPGWRRGRGDARDSSARGPWLVFAVQWLKLLDFADEIRAFIQGNAGKLKKKE